MGQQGSHRCTKVGQQALPKPSSKALKSVHGGGQPLDLGLQVLGFCFQPDDLGIASSDNEGFFKRGLSQVMQKLALSPLLKALVLKWMVRKKEPITQC